MLERGLALHGGENRSLKGEDTSNSRIEPHSVLNGVVVLNHSLDGGREIIGSVAGDDTIICVVRSEQDTVSVMDKIKKIVS